MVQKYKLKGGSTSVPVTDVVWPDEDGKVHKGFWMDGYLRQNLDPIPNFLKKAWDVVGIVSGHGKVRIGKSTLALQTAYYIAWRLAGGEMGPDEFGNVVVTKTPHKEVRFGMENIVFSADDLMDKAAKLPKNSVIVYDEGRAGLESARAMENINKGMQDFFQECGIYNHIIIIVLPNFFKLHEDYAVARSMFLLDVHTDANFERGYFNGYNELQKERLYFFGKKLIGITAKYMSAHPSFYGKFSKWLPVDKDVYENAKKDALKKKKVSRYQKKFKKQRDAAIYMAKRYSEMSHEDVAAELSALSNSNVSHFVVERAIAAVTHKKETFED